MNNTVTNYSFPFIFTHQKIALSYLHPDNPFRSLILFYKIGSGKTYIAACLAQLYLIEGYSVLYLSNTINSIANFKNEYNKMIGDMRFKLKIAKIDFVTFTGLYKNTIDKDYGIIIIDEVHNLRENAVRYDNIKQKLNKCEMSKILIMTATPIIDNINEITSIIKLCNEEPKILFSEDAKVNNIKVEYVGKTVDDKTLFLSTMTDLQLENYNNIKNDTIFSLSRQAAISYGENFDLSVPLYKQSCKIHRLTKCLNDEVTVIFCFYIKRGIKFLKQVLEYLGYEEWKPHKPKSNTKKFAVISGETKEEDTNRILKEYNSIANLNGKLINILIGSSVLHESITLYRVTQIHILSPFWNYGHVEQSIGRAIRYNSHIGAIKDRVQIYLHACTNSIEMKMWDITFDKQKLIQNKIVTERTKKYEINIEKEFEYPEPDNILIFKIDNEIWDLTNCFEHNKFKISWCKVYHEKAICYNLDKKEKIICSVPSYKFKINQPLPNGYTIWRSCIDNRLRLSYLNQEKKNKYSKRGKLLCNVNSKLIEQELGCDNLSNYLKQKNRYFDKQIEYVV